MNTHLIDCPWCQNPESDRRIAFEDRTDQWGDPYRTFFGECECGAHGPHAATVEEAMIAYNSWKR
jgi:hypothetical protein